MAGMDIIKRDCEQSENKQEMLLFELTAQLVYF